MSGESGISFVLTELRPRHGPAMDRLQARPDVQSRLGRVIDVRDNIRSNVRAIEIDGELVGVAGLVPSGALDGTEIELVCALLEEHAKRGLATAACSRILTAEAGRRQRQRVLASIAPENSDAKRLAERLGFKQIGTRMTSPDELWALSLADLVIAAV